MRHTGTNAASEYPIALLVPRNLVIPSVAAAALASLAFLGGLSASVGGASIVQGCLRVSFWGIVAMAVTSVIGWLFDVVV